MISWQKEASTLASVNASLLVIARALLCGASIVMLDEATAAVDADTDAFIQKVLHTEFAKATTVMVAHRLNTIVDSDYILVCLLYTSPSPRDRG